MKIYGINASNQFARNKFRFQQTNNKMTQPNFGGTAYKYDAHCGDSDRGLGSYCYIYNNNGDIIAKGTSSMYSDSDEAVVKALKNLHPGHNNTEIIAINPNKCYYNGEKGSVYLADPEEGITQEMREKYDYIATEKRPPIPTLEQLNHKFHAIYGDDTDYNSEIKNITAYHTRLLKADLITRNNLELKNIEDEENLQQSKSNRNKYYFDHLRQPYSEEITNKLNTESYYVYQNEQNINDNKAKMDYYDARIKSSREKIKYTVELEHILDKAGGILIQRDIASKKLLEDKNNLEVTILNHIDTVHSIKVKQAEKRYYIEQLNLLEQQKNKISKQKCAGNEASYRVWDRTANLGGYEFRTQKEEIKEQIKKVNQELHNLKLEKIRLGERIANSKPVVEEDLKAVEALIAQADGIYQELEAYYKANNPF